MTSSDHRVLGRQPEFVVTEDQVGAFGIVGRVRPACASRQNRCTGASLFSAVAPEASKSRSTEAIARPVARTWSRRARARSSNGISLPSLSSAYSSPTLPISWRHAASMSRRLGDAHLCERVVLGLRPRTRRAHACPGARRGRRRRRTPCRRSAPRWSSDARCPKASCRPGALVCSRPRSFIDLYDRNRCAVRRRP